MHIMKLRHLQKIVKGKTFTHLTKKFKEPFYFVNKHLNSYTWEEEFIQLFSFGGVCVLSYIYEDVSLEQDKFMRKDIYFTVNEDDSCTITHSKLSNGHSYFDGVTVYEKN